MDLNRACWYVRWFFWSLGICDVFRDRDTAWLVERDGISLCPFIRIMLVYAPLVIAFHAVVYVAAFMTLTAMPIYLFGGSAYLWGIGDVIILTLIIVGIKKLNAWLDVRTPVSHAPKIKKVSTSSGPSFFAVIRQWLVAVHEKICPTITFVANQKKEG